jgi:hypothetical protein
LLGRNRGNGEVAKTVKAIMGGDPDIAFAILKESINEIAGQTVGPRKQIHRSLVHMHQAPVRRSDPDTAVAIPEQLRRIEP